MDANRNTADDPWLSIAAAGRAIGVTKPTVHAMIARGELETTRFGGRLFVHRDSAEAVRAEREQQQLARQRARASA